ncbi:nuclear condensing complex subunit [Amylocarpus encephaloides]|uniref:Nuclear condensing complex subunit n=1 Tax=Amylocarpus encephaloides TaxID=45428 RepID=A0A9P8C2U2_9HELO|nr:nuclear condensing complex subunit [Amylocarpus encephaloides]
MPGRVSARSTRTLNSRASTSSRISAPAITIPEETEDNTLRTQISSIFRDVQRTTASHRKFVVSLRKIQESCCYEATSHKKKKKSKDGEDVEEAEEFDEEQFVYEFTRCVLRIMPVKKSENVGERTVRFVGGFLKQGGEKDDELTTRLISHLMRAILPLLTAKDKFVRYRSTQLIAHVINSVEEIEEDVFAELRHGLLKRIHDKEAIVRVQAVLGLGRLAGTDADGQAEDSDDDDNAAGLLEKLIEILQNDPSADVRRSLLINLPLLPTTLPYLLERARDQDAATRRALYSRLLPTLGDFRHLSLSMREKILRWGLRDRDELVRKAAGKLFRERWIEDCVSTIEAEGQAETEESQVVSTEIKPPNFEALLELLERIDVVNSGVENGVALEAMKGFWEGRPDYCEAVTLNDYFWDTLSAESVFMARSFNDYCMNYGGKKCESLLEEKMPEVIKLAFYLERYITVLVQALNRVASQEPTEDVEEEDTVEQEFIVEQMLHIAHTVDYSDEVGRRKMITLLRTSLRIPDLPEEVTKLIIEGLRGICSADAAGEREFISIVLDAAADVHDTVMDEPRDEDAEESFHSARSEVDEEGTPEPGKRSKMTELTEEEAQDRAIREIMVNMKCLHIVQCMLESVSSDLQQNQELVLCLNNLVVPAVRSHEVPVRERGLLCLGLCALLDKSLAEENLTLFAHFYTKGHSTLQITALQIITDILNKHGAHLLETNPTLVKVYLKSLKSGSKAPEVQAVATIAVSKLILGRVITDTSTALEDLLETLTVLYFDPSSQHNQGVRQTLSYSLPVYCFSRPENQDRMRKVALNVMHKLFVISETLDDEDEADAEMVSLSTIGAHLVDWTDPRKCYVLGDKMSFDDVAKKHVNGDVHLQFARDLLEKLGSNISREEKKSLAPLLAKLYLSPASTETLIRELYDEVSLAIDDKLIPDAPGRNALLKIHVSLGKIINSLTEKEKAAPTRDSRKSSVALSVAGDEGTVIPGEGENLAARAGAMRIDDDVKKSIEEDTRDGEESENEGTVIAASEPDDQGTPKRRKVSPQVRRDSLVDSLLSDDRDVGMWG